MTTQQADIKESRKLSGIWIIPVLALLLGGYMVIHTWMTEGPEIEIAFEDASGLTAGKTKVKYKSVDMGLVEDVRLSADFEGVIAKVKLNRQALPLLREDTRFWVVTAQVGAGRITGLDTLLSGAYIELAPGTGAEGRRQFIALEHSPLTPTGADGVRLHLVSDRANSVSAGDTVLYKGYKVGRVEKREFNPDTKLVSFVIFIDAPFHKLVNTAVRFWDASGISFSAGADGIKFETRSLESVILGGVTFDLPPGISPGEPVEHGDEFKLYPSREESLENPFKHGTHYVATFAESVKGVLPGAPVEYRGIVIGRIEKLLVEEMLKNSMANTAHGRGDPIPVLLYLEPGRLGLPDKAESLVHLEQAITTGVKHGMRASLETGSLLTGAKYISIDYFDNVEDATLGIVLGYPSLPTISTGLGQIEHKLTALLDKINSLPLEDTVSEGNAAIASLHATLESLNVILEDQSTQAMPEELAATLRDLRTTLNGLSPDSEAYRSLSSSLLRLNRTLGNLESLTRTLSEQPNAAIMPSSPAPDPIPEVSQ